MSRLEPLGSSLTHPSDFILPGEGQKDGFSPARLVLLVAGYSLVAYAIMVSGAPENLSEILLGTHDWGPDNVLNASILEWGHSSLLSGNLDIFDWPPGYPYSNTLAGTENLIGLQIFYTPLRLSGLSIATAVNWTVVGLFVVGAVFTALLARRYLLSWQGATIAGLIFGFAPFRLEALIQLQTVAASWCPLVFLTLLDLLDDPSGKRAFAFGSSLVITALSSVYFGIFVTIGVLVFLAATFTTGERALSSADLKWLTAGVALAAVLLSPVAVHYLEFGSAHGFSSSQAEAVRGSLAVLNLFHVPDWLRFWGSTPFSGASRYSGAFPGLAPVILASIGLFGMFRSTETNRIRWVVLLVCMVVTLILALGPKLKIHQGYPSRIADYVPLPGRVLYSIPGLRMAYRIYLLTLLFLALFAGKGLDQLLAKMGRTPRRLIAGVTVLLIVAEFLPGAQFYSESSRLPQVEPTSRSTDCVPEDQTRAVADIPTEDSVGNHNAPMAMYTLESVIHKRRTISYYLSQQSLAQSNSLQAIVDSLPHPRARHLLSSSGVSHLVIHKTFLGEDSLRSLTQSLKEAGITAACESTHHAVMRLDPN